MKNKGWTWVFIWRFVFKPVLKMRYWLIMRKYGWEGRYNKEIERWRNMNSFYDLNEFE